MVVKDPATVVMMGFQTAWNALVIAWRVTLIAGLTMVVINPDSWLTKFLAAIISVVVKIATEFIARIQIELLGMVLDASVETLKVFPLIVTSDVMTNVSRGFSAIAFSLITAFFLYQVIKNTFSHLGFDGEANLNTLIMYIVTIALLIFLNPIIATLLQITYDISMIFIGSISEFGGGVARSLRSATSVGASVQAVAVSILVVLLLAKIIMMAIDLGFTIIQRIAVISILIAIGPIIISFGVLKSMRNVSITWMKTIFVTNLVFLMYAVMMFFISHAMVDILDDISAGELTGVVKLFVSAGLIMSVTKVDDIIVNLFMGQPTAGGGPANMGVSTPGPGGIFTQSVGTIREKYGQYRQNRSSMKENAETKRWQSDMLKKMKDLKNEIRDKK